MVRIEKIIPFFFLLSLLMVNCGGGGGGDDQTSTQSPYYVDITIPEWSDKYKTDQPTISLGGSSFVPDGSTCSSGSVLAKGYSVTCLNSSGYCSYINVELNCIAKVFVSWETGPIPLLIGDNKITITATDAQGHTGQDSITVTRVLDTSIPTVVSVSPVDGSTISIMPTITIVFSEHMDASTINSTNITFTDAIGNQIAGSLSYVDDLLSAYLTPYSLLLNDTKYQLTVSTGVKDAGGDNPLATNYIYSFTTVK